MPPEKSHEQTVLDAINPAAGVVRLDALVDYLQARRAAAQTAVMRRGRGDAECEYSRGQYAAAGALLALLTPPDQTDQTDPNETETP